MSNRYILDDNDIDCLVQKALEFQTAIDSGNPLAVMATKRDLLACKDAFSKKKVPERATHFAEFDDPLSLIWREEIPK